MANPYGIEQVDVPGLIGIYQGAKDRRVNEMLLQRKIAAEDREIARSETISKAYRNLQPPGQAKGGGQTTPAGGMAAAYAPPAQQAAPPASFDPNMPTGSPLSPATLPEQPGAPVAAPAAEAPPQPAQMPQGWYEANKGVVDQLMTVEPQQAFQLMTQLQGLDAAQIKKAEASAEMMAQVAEHLHSFPEGPARQAEIARISPDLMARGVPAEKIQSVDTSDKGLQWLFVHGTDLKTVIDREKEERQFAETQRHNRASESNAAGGLEVRRGALGLARGREGRIASGKGGAAAGGGDVGGLSTADLIRMAGGD